MLVNKPPEYGKQVWKLLNFIENNGLLKSISQVQLRVRYQSVALRRELQVQVDRRAGELRLNSLHQRSFAHLPWAYHHHSREVADLIE